jgi:hypothetical protein
MASFNGNPYWRDGLPPAGLILARIKGIVRKHRRRGAGFWARLRLRAGLCVLKDKELLL